MMIVTKNMKSWLVVQNLRIALIKMFISVHKMFISDMNILIKKKHEVLKLQDMFKTEVCCFVYMFFSW